MPSPARPPARAGKGALCRGHECQLRPPRCLSSSTTVLADLRVQNNLSRGTRPPSCCGRVIPLATDSPMQLGMVGLGRMGAGLVRRLIRAGHRCVGYDISADARKAVESAGCAGAEALEELAARLEK